MDFEKKYWSDGEFTLNGLDYSGYVGIYKGDGYTYDGEEKLEKKDSYKVEFNSSKNFHDRILDNELKLPFERSQLQVHANDFLHRSVIKNILQRLQINNDYIYKNAIISDTLVPAVDDCSILATTDNTRQKFIGKSGESYDVIDRENGSYEDVVSNYILNPLFDANKPVKGKNFEGMPNALPIDENSKTTNLKNFGNYQWIPTIQEVVDLTYGEMTRYNLLEKKKTRTALDPTFYPVYDKSGKIVSEPLFNFNDITGCEMVITSMGVNPDYGKYANLKIFILFKTKLVVIKYRYYVDNFYGNNNDPKCATIDFKNIGLRDKNGELLNKQIICLETVDPSNKNSLKFLNLQAIHIHKNNLFLVDSTLNMVLRYDISWLTNDDYILEDDESLFENKLIRLIDNLQGDGKLYNQIYFNAPSSIAANDDNIFIADNGNHCIKVYNTSFNYVTTIKSTAFNDRNISTISVNPYSFELEDGTKIPKNTLWVFSTSSSALFITIINNKKIILNKRIEKITILEDKFTWEETFKSAKFSFTNSNYFYISTTKRVYKFHLSNPLYPFASLSYFKQRAILTSMVWNNVPYPWHILPAGRGEDDICITWSYRPSKTSAEILDNKAFCLTGNDSRDLIVGTNEEEQFNGDIVFHIGTLYDQSAVDTYLKRNNAKFEEIPQEELAKMVKCSGVFLYNETPSFLSSLTRDDMPCYIKEDIKDIKRDEYINPITFNKAVYKIIYNLVNLKNTIIGHFQGGYNLDNIMTYDQLIYDDYFQNLRIENNHDFFIHDNEPTSIVLNRIFDNIYNIQKDFIKKMEASYVTSPNLTNNSFRII